MVANMRRLALGFAIGVLSAAPAPAHVAPCADSVAVAATRAAADDACTAMGVGCTTARSHGGYVSCIAHEAKAAAKARTLPKECKGAVVRCAAKSTCGKSGFVTCCRTTANGKTSCAIKRGAARCTAPKHGTACVGRVSSCCDACVGTACAQATTTTSTTLTRCGNGTCDVTEDCGSCPTDCGACPTIAFASDPTWKTFTSDPDVAVPPAPLGFAQHVCANPCAPPTCPVDATIYSAGCGPALGVDLSSIPGATWIWAPGVTGATGPAEFAQFWFSKTLTLPAAPTSATISVAVDDFAEVRVNGMSVGSTGSTTDATAAAAAQASLATFDIRPFLSAGTNTITVRGQNGSGSFASCSNCTYAENPASVVFGGSIAFGP